MKKINYKFLIITVIVIILPMIYGVVNYSKLPEQMAVHFSTENVPNNYVSKNFAIFGLPLILALLQVICIVTTDINYNRKNDGKHPIILSLVKWIIPAISLLSNIIIVRYNLGYQIDVRTWVCMILGLIFLISGNYIPKISYEDSKLIMHPIPKNEKTFRKIIRTMGFSFVIFGFLLIISCLFKPIVSIIVISLLVLTLLCETIYIKVKK